MVLNKRQSELLDMILQGKNLQLKELEKKFNVSRRTVYNDVAHIREWAELASVHLIVTADSLLAINDEKDKLLLENKLKNTKLFELPLNQFSRSNLIITRLLFEDEPPLMNDLCNSVGVSRSTFYRDLEYIRYWFDKFEIQIVITKTDGVVLSGKESHIREAMVFFVRKNFDEFDLWTCLQKNINTFKQEKSFIFPILQNYFKKFSFSLPAQILEKMQIFEKTVIQDKEKLFFIWIFMMSLARIEKHHEIEADERFIEIMNSNESILLYDLLNQKLFFKVSQLEAAALAFYYITARKRSNQGSNLTLDLDTQILKFVERISKRLGISLIRDTTLIEGLRLHILNTIDRLNMGMADVNPMKEEIRKRYPNIFEICTHEIEDTIQFERPLEDDEIAYIVIYIAAAIERLNQSNKRVYAVCTSGRGSAELLLVNLKNKLPNLNVLGTISMMSAIHVAPSQADAIISTTQISNAQIPVIAVSPLLLKEDLSKIRKALNLNAENIHVAVSPVFTQNEMGFMDTMYLLSDCANAMDEMMSELKLDLSHAAYVGILIHLMLQINRSENIKKINENSLDKEQKVLFNILNTLYNKYNKVVSDYDIRSIQTYLTEGKEIYEDIIRKRQNL